MGLSVAAIAAISTAVVSAAGAGLSASGVIGPNAGSADDPTKDAAKKAREQEAKMRRLLATRGGRNLTEKTQGQALGGAATQQSSLSAQRLGG